MEKRVIKNILHDTTKIMDRVKSNYSETINTILFNCTKNAIDLWKKNIHKESNKPSGFQPRNVYSALQKGFKVEKIEYEYSTFDERDYNVMKEYY